MNKLLYKTGSGIATAAIIAQGFAGIAFAGLDVQITGNGADSKNTADVTTNTSTTVTQDNVANITNNVNVSADTGNNDANRNTGGDVSVETGDASADVNVSNTANMNVANVDNCCLNDLSVEISGNGADSKNDADVIVKNNTWIDQDNQAKIKNNVYVDADSGYNDANRNTGGNVDISTGDANAAVTVSNMANKNIASIGNGSNGGGTLAVVISGNGANSKNNADVRLTSNKTIWQNNVANITNKVKVDADTGRNDANRNTGGDVSIDTGDAIANVDVSNLANFNSADISGCGCILDGLIKIAGNGADSKNDAKVKLVSSTFVDQNNVYTCGRSRGGWEKGRRGKSSSCNDVYVDVDSGNNDANRNTGEGDGDPSITTGNAEADVVVETTANSNEVGNAGFDFDFPETNGNTLLIMLLAFFS